MDGYATKNYTEQGGERTVIGGELVIKDGGRFILENGQSIGEGGSSDPQSPQATYQANSTAGTVEELRADFNVLLAKLIAAGLMKDKLKDDD